MNELSLENTEIKTRFHNTTIVVTVFDKANNKVAAEYTIWTKDLGEFSLEENESDFKSSLLSEFSPAYYVNQEVIDAAFNDCRSIITSTSLKE